MKSAVARLPYWGNWAIENITDVGTADWSNRVKSKETICPMCGRRTPPEHVEKHHPIPKSKGGKARVSICCDCHGAIHRFFKAKELPGLMDIYDGNLRGLMEVSEEMRNFVGWVRKKKRFGFTRATRKAKR